jgi:hypothetical protein
VETEALAQLLLFPVLPQPMLVAVVAQRLEEPLDQVVQAVGVEVKMVTIARQGQQIPAVGAGAVATVLEKLGGRAS